MTGCRRSTSLVRAGWSRCALARGAGRVTAASVSLLVWAWPAAAQLAPVRECALVGRPILVWLGPGPGPHVRAGEVASGPGASTPAPTSSEKAVPPPADEAAGRGDPSPLPELEAAEGKPADEGALAPAGERPAPDAAGPARARVTDEPLRIELINAETLRPIDAKPARAGEVDLAELFPRLWKAESPVVMLAQAVEGERRVGAAVVLVPMVAPRVAVRTDREGLPQFAPAPRPRPLGGYWTFADQHAVLKTGRGELVFRLRADAAPASVMHFRDLVRKGFYDGIRIHRVASLRGQPLPDIVQLGDPTGTGHGGPGFMIDMEDSPLRHAYGVLSFARAADPNSAGSQVIIDLSKEAAAALDRKYTAFGELVGGGAALTAIAKTPVDADGRPREDLLVLEARLVDAPPVGSGPKPVTDPLDVPAGR